MVNEFAGMADSYYVCPTERTYGDNYFYFSSEYNSVFAEAKAILESGIKKLRSDVSKTWPYERRIENILTNFDSGFITY
jgi:hypothetical protein